MNTSDLNNTESTTVEPVKFPEGAMTSGPSVVTTLTVGNHPGTVLNARIARNFNGKKYLEVDVQLDHGIRTQYVKFLTTAPLVAQVKKELARAFGMDNPSAEALSTITGKRCVLNCREDEYKGKTTIRPAFINPYNESADFDFDAEIAETPADSVTF
jgi:hypothetical protein